jgi:uncharacterized protein
MSIRPQRTLRTIFVLSVLLLTIVTGALAVSPNVVISQVYGGGGNTGATYKNDFIELYNRGSVAITLNGWSVQYASAAGTSWAVTNLTGTIQPGGYYLIQESQGAGGTTALPTPDATGTIAMSATAGKVALVSSTTALTGSCPSASSVDFVGFGTTASCFEGAGPAPAPSNTLADIRAGGGTTDTDVNSSDFSTGAPNPHNAGPTSSAPTGAGSANPSSGNINDTVLLTVTVTPGTNPTSSGIQVMADLSAIGGSATQSFSGDANNVFTFSATVAAGSIPGNKSLPVTVSDAQLRNSSTTIAFTVNAPPPPVVAIHTVQGSGSSSPYAGQAVSVVGVVTALRSNGFFVQTPDSQIDSDPQTPEAIFVFTGSPTPSVAVVGNEVMVSGLVSEFQPSGSRLTVTELGTPLSYQLISTGNALPAPITLTAADTDPAGSFTQLQKYEAMRVHVDSVTSISGTSGSYTESSATGTSNGTFFAVITGVARPFREPGLEISSTLPVPTNTPHWDENPERIRVDADGQVGATNFTVTSNTIVQNLTGVLDYASDAYTILPDPGTTPTVGSTMSAVAVRDAAANEFTVASFNMQHFFNAIKDDSGTVLLTAAAYDRRLAKASLAIRNVLRMPDIIGIEEIENDATLQDLANRVNSDAVAAGQSNPQYLGCTYQGNDIGGIDVAILYKSARVAQNSCEQIGKDTTYIDPSTNTAALLNDRPPVVFNATVTPATGSPANVTVVVNHLRSLISNGDDTADGNRVRTKRLTQAEFLAKLLAEHQAAGENVVAVGDFNAFQIDDGTVDVLGTVRGAPLPSDEILLTGGDYVDPDFSDLITTLPADQQYTYVENGSAQVLDHVVVSQSLLNKPYAIQVAHNNADFPELYRNDPLRPERMSDHDMPVGFFSFPKADPSVSFSSVSSLLTGNATSYSFTVSNSGPDAAQQVSVTKTLPAGATVNVTAPAGWTCTTGSSISCTATSLAAGASATFSVSITPACALSNGTVLSSTVSVSSATEDSDSTNNSATQNWTASNPAPVVSPITLSKSTITDLNHKLVTIGLSYSITDNCDASITPVVTVTSNQPSDASGDGHTLFDSYVVNNNTVQVRAERAGVSGDDRIYTITVTAMDSAGSSTSSSAQVVVPHNN